MNAVWIALIVVCELAERQALDGVSRPHRHPRGRFPHADGTEVPRMTGTQARLAPAEVAGRMPERPRPAAAGQLGSLSRAMLRSFFRDRTSLFFTFPFH